MLDFGAKGKNANKHNICGFAAVTIVLHPLYVKAVCAFLKRARVREGGKEERAAAEQRDEKWGNAAKCCAPFWLLFRMGQGASVGACF